MIKINLAPPITRKRGVSLAVPGFNLGLLFGGLIALEIVVLGGWWLMLGAEAARLQRDIAQAEKEVARLQVAIAEGQRFKRDKEQLERRVNAIESVARNQTRPVYLLDALLDTIPEDLWLTRMEEKGQQLRLAGTTHSSVTLADFMANLKASRKFKDVDLIESRQDLSKSPRLITFEVICRFEI